MDLFQSNTKDGTQGVLLSIISVFHPYLTIEDGKQVCEQFQGPTWRRNSQVMWSGMLREDAQRWADEHDMQTLTTAMGPLMAVDHPLCLRSKKLPQQWSEYVRSASAIYAWHVAQENKVTVLLPPPPDRLHPSGLTNYQAIEEPILKARSKDGEGLRIEIVHPMVKGAESFSYQIWPIDETETWTANFGALHPRTLKWRQVKMSVQRRKYREVIREILHSGLKVYSERPEEMPTPTRRCMSEKCIGPNLEENCKPKDTKAASSKTKTRKMKITKDKQVATNMNATTKKKEKKKKKAPKDKQMATSTNQNVPITAMTTRKTSAKTAVKMKGKEKGLAGKKIATNINQMTRMTASTKSENKKKKKRGNKKKKMTTTTMSNEKQVSKKRAS